MNKIIRFNLIAPAALPLLLVFCGSCDVAPGATVVLRGTWEVVKDADPNGDKVLLTFDAFGNLTRFAAVSGETTVTTPNPTGTTTLDGLSITITASVDSFKFEGTFNADFTEATGTQYTEWEWFGTLITTNEGAATMTKT
jgi:hypothetical protein